MKQNIFSSLNNFTAIIIQQVQFSIKRFFNPAFASLIKEFYLGKISYLKIRESFMIPPDP